VIDLSRKTAVVTGGSRGIGRAIAAALLGHGARVAIGGRNAGRLTEAAAALRQAAGDGGGSSGERLLTVQGDVSREEDAAKLVSQTVERFGGLDILVNNAAVGRFAQVADMSSDHWHEVIDSNVTGVFFCCRAALPHLKRRGGGWIVNISSLASENPFIGGAAYCASKAALNAFTAALMMETRYDDIRVTMVLPGSVQTEFSGSSTAGADWKLSADDVAQTVLDLIAHPARSLPSRVDLRPAKPAKR
jgi:3-oxoacyl-[acyl-carrier protein] reductase